MKIKNQTKIHIILINRLLLILVLVFPVTIVMSQNESANWYFGNNAGISFIKGSPVSNSDGKLKSGEGCASISDKTGNLLFYTDGLYVWNKDHKPMPNGFKLHGHRSSTQSAYIVPKPASNFIYYIFTLDCEAGDNGVCYSIVDMNLDNGNGDVTEKNSLLRKKCTEKIAVYKHDNKNDLWVVIHDFNSNAFIAYLLTKNGISTIPVISNVGIKHEISKYNNIGYMKFSADGKRLAVAVNGMDCVQLFDFDNKTGLLSNPVNIQFPKYSKPYGVEFSPTGNFLYIGLVTTGKTYQINLKLKDGATMSKKMIMIGQSVSHLSIGALQLAIDQKIYVSENLSNYLAAIEQPDSFGIKCKYNSQEVFLKDKTCTLGLPIFYLTTKVHQNDIPFFDTTTKIQLNQKYIFSNVHFDTDKAMLNRESQIILKALLDYLKTHNSVKLEIVGHTDAIGSAQHNNKLSLLRATEVRNFLVKNKIQAARISVKGKGFYEPIDENDTETGRHKNRRIEFVLFN